MKTSQRPALGRGLGALLPGGPSRDGATAEGPYVDCPLDRIDLAPEQPRTHFDEARLAELAASIRDKGILQPLVVTRNGDRYCLIAGERRLRAAKMVGLRTAPAIVKDITSEETFELALIENIQREDLNPLEEAHAYQRLIERHGYTQAELAERVGKERSTVANALRLLQLPEEARAPLAAGTLSPGHARALLSVADEGARKALLDDMLTTGMSVREAERRARSARPKGPERGPRPQPLSPLMAILERELSEHLQTHVQLKTRTRRSGTIFIHYDSLEALSRIHRLIVGEATPADAFSATHRDGHVKEPAAL